MRCGDASDDEGSANSLDEFRGTSLHNMKNRLRHINDPATGVVGAPASSADGVGSSSFIKVPPAEAPPLSRYRTRRPKTPTSSRGRTTSGTTRARRVVARARRVVATRKPPPCGVGEDKSPEFRTENSVKTSAKSPEFGEEPKSVKTSAKSPEFCALRSLSR